MIVISSLKRDGQHFVIKIKKKLERNGRKNDKFNKCSNISTGVFSVI